MPQSVIQSPAGHVSTFTSGTTGTSSPTYVSNTTAGSCLLAAISFYSDFATTITSVTTNGTAENWVFLYEDADTYVQWWINPDTAGGQTIIDINVSFGGTATTSNSVTVLARLWEDGGLGTTVIADVTQSFNPGSGATSFASNSGTPDTTTQADEIWHAAVGVAPVAANTTSTVTQTTGGWTNGTLLSSSYQVGGTGTADKYNVYLQAGSQVVTAIGSPAYDGTMGASSIYGASVVTLAPPVATAVGGTVQPAATVATPRRNLFRAIWRGITGQAYTAVPPPKQLPPGPRSPAPRRAVVQFTPVRTVNQGPPVPGTVQPLPARPAPRRTPARAVILFRPVTTVNQAPVKGTVQPLAARPAPRRILARAVIQFTPVRTVNRASAGGTSLVEGSPHVISPFAATINQGAVGVISPYTEILIQEWDQ
jgi:hypothetical protein